MVQNFKSTGFISKSMFTSSISITADYLQAVEIMLFQCLITLHTGYISCEEIYLILTHVKMSTWCTYEGFCRNCDQFTPIHKNKKSNEHNLTLYGL